MHCTSTSRACRAAAPSNLHFQFAASFLKGTFIFRLIHRQSDGRAAGADTARIRPSVSLGGRRRRKRQHRRCCGRCAAACARAACAACAPVVPAATLLLRPAPAARPGRRDPDRASQAPHTPTRGFSAGPCLDVESSAQAQRRLDSVLAGCAHEWTRASSAPAQASAERPRPQHPHAQPAPLLAAHPPPPPAQPRVRPCPLPRRRLLHRRAAVTARSLRSVAASTPGFPSSADAATQPDSDPDQPTPK